MTDEVREITYRDAVREAIREALLADPRVFLMGEDVGRYGGCYAVTKGLLDEFGPDRIRDTPLSESAFVGAGIGAALGGMRPIVEIMTVNFSLLALDQIVNNAATIRHMSGGQFEVPVVIRMATGAGRQLAAQHSHSLEGWYAHIPGLKVLTPATLEDARFMLAAALADPNPVLIFEHVMLYNRSGVLSADAGPVDIRSAIVRRPGKHVTLVTYGGTLFKTLDAAETLAKDGVEAEVVDLRVLRPLDARDRARLGAQDASGRNRRRRLAQRQPFCRNQRADHGGGILGARRTGWSGVQRRGADPLSPSPRGGGTAAAGGHRRGSEGGVGRLMGEFRMPSLGADMEAGTLVEWLKRPGDRVKRGDIVAVVETQKGAIEVDIFEEGVIERWLVEPGTTVPVGTPLALIADAQPAAATTEAEVTAAAAPTPAPTVPISVTPPLEPRTEIGRPRMSPAARRLAAERGVSLDRLIGSGPDGAIVYADVERAAAAEPVPRPTAPKRLDLAEMRRAIAAAMARSKREIPHYYLSTTSISPESLAWLEAANATRPPAQRLLLAALLLKAVARALGEAREFNGFFTAEGFQPGAGIHIGTAIAIRGGGLVAPAIRDADKLSARRADGATARSRRSRAQRRAAQLRAVGSDDHGHQSGRTQCRDGIRGHLSAPGRARRLRHARRTALGRRRRGRRSAGADGDPRRRPPRQRWPSRCPVSRRYRPQTAEPGDAMTRDDVSRRLNRRTRSDCTGDGREPTRSERRIARRARYRLDGFPQSGHRSQRAAQR